MPHILKCATHLAQDNVWHCLNIISEICYWNTLVPIKKITVETKPERVGFISTSPPSSRDHFAKTFVFAHLSSSSLSNTWQFLTCLSCLHVFDTVGLSTFLKTHWCVHKAEGRATWKWSSGLKRRLARSAGCCALLFRAGLNNTLKYVTVVVTQPSEAPEFPEATLPSAVPYCYLRQPTHRCSHTPDHSAAVFLGWLINRSLSQLCTELSDFCPLSFSLG